MDELMKMLLKNFHWLQKQELEEQDAMDSKIIQKYNIN
jgi:hypothetical protein